MVSVSLACGCSNGPAPLLDSPIPPAQPATQPDPPPFTFETLGGTLYAPANAKVAWAYTFPGELASPPAVARGPGDELIALAIVERRPKPPTKLLEDTLLLRFDADSGKLLWLEQLAGYSNFALDTQGNILLAPTGALEKRSPDGTLLWTQPKTSANMPGPLSIAVDADDHILVTRIELDASASELAGASRGYAELDKLDPEGNPEWSHRFGDGTAYLDAALVTTDPSKDVILLASNLTGPFDFGGSPIVDNDVLVKYDPDGNYLFEKALGGYATYYTGESSPIQTDAAGDIFERSESLAQPVDVGLGPLTCIRYFFKFDALGNPLLSQCIDADGFTALPDGGFIVESTLERDTTLGNVNCTVADRDSEGSEVMLARYDAQGNWIATQCAADPGYQYTGNVAPDPTGMFFMTAAFNVQLTLPDGTIAEPVDDYYSALVAKVDVNR